MPARLHHERITRRETGLDGSSLAGQVLAGDQAATVAAREPAHWLLMVHGIYGSGANWRGIARKLTERRPEWGVVLVDLRQHGRSEPGSPPHTIAACADDLRALIVDLGGVDAIAGHSFGGKVVLAMRPLVRVQQNWVLDSSPSARPLALADPANGVARLLDLMARLPRTWDTREAFIAALVAEGQDPTTAQWLAMNVVPDPAGGFHLRLDPGALREMLTDFYQQDLWASLADPTYGRVEMVVAATSAAVSEEDRARLVQMPPHVQTHMIEAGHWLHVEAPAEVVELFATTLAPGDS